MSSIGIIFPQLSAIEQKLDLVISQISALNQILTSIEQKENTMASALDSLSTQVQANTDVEKSAITLIEGLAQQIKEAGTDPVKLQALSDELKASADALAAAVVANTPAA